jgi:glyoxylase-like metal-dependent hydrolase (beta-lactamase superfamily II)
MTFHGADALDGAEWIHGSRRPGRSTDPAIQVLRYDDQTFIMRQSKAVHYEAPFLFLLVGEERALLLDTGATPDPARFPLRATVDGLIGDRELIVAHTHSHGDHVAGDGQFADRPTTTIVGHRPEDVRAFFGFEHWPDSVVEFDLGGRVLELVGSPGHHAASVTFYDPRTAILFTGDTVMPARLYTNDYPAFLATLDRLAAFTAERPVRHVLGCHVEMTTRAGRDYPLGARYQPDEVPPQMSAVKLREIRDAAHKVAGRRGVHAFDDYIIYNQAGRRPMTKLLVRGLLDQVRTRFRR